MEKRLFLVLLVLAGIALASGSVVLSIDGSGSMRTPVNGTLKFELARNASLCLVDQLQPGDEMAIYLFENSNTVNRVRSFTNSTSTLKSSIRALSPDYGGTDLRGGINESGTYLLEHGKFPVKILIVISDGGSASTSLNRTAAALHAQGVDHISVVGVNVRDNASAGKALANIAENGGGQFYSTLDYSDACEAFTEAYDDAVAGGNVEVSPTPTQTPSHTATPHGTATPSHTATPHGTATPGGGGGGKLCPLFFLLPAALVALLAVKK